MIVFLLVNALSLRSFISDDNSSEPTKLAPDHLPTVLSPFNVKVEHFK